MTTMACGAPARRTGIASRPGRLALASGLAILSLLALAGCASHPPEPLAPERDLAALDGLAEARVSRAPALDLPALTAAALELNPELRALRAEVGIASAQLVQAGLLPDPTFYFNTMDIFAARAYDGGSSPKDVVTGLALDWTVPRPGEISARKGSAQASLDEARCRVLAAEWDLARRVALAYTEVGATLRHVALHRRFFESATRVLAVLEEARSSDKATDLEVNLATVDLAVAEVDRLSVEAEEAAAHRALRDLLGLPPGQPLGVQVPDDHFRIADAQEDAGALFQAALGRRPDIRELEARHRRAEEELRLQCALRWPPLTIGTAFALGIPIFSQFNAAGVDLALAAREKARLDYVAAVRALRGEIHAACAGVSASGARLRRSSERLRPTLDKSEALASQAFRAGTLGAVETFAAKLLLLRAEEQHLESVVEHTRRRIELDAAAGRLLGGDGETAGGGEEVSQAEADSRSPSGS